MSSPISSPGLDPARLEEHLLAVDDLDAGVLERGEDGQLDDVDPERLAEQPVDLQLALDLAGDLLGDPGVGVERPAQGGDPGARTGLPRGAVGRGAVVRRRGRRPVRPLWSSHGAYSWWCRAAEPKSQMIGSPPRTSSEKRISLSIAHVPMWVAVM